MNYTTIMNIQGFIKKEQMLTLWTLHTKGTCLFCPRTGPILRLITAIGSAGSLHGQWQTCIHNLSWFYHDLYILSSISRWEPKLFKCTNMKQGNEKKKHHNESFFQSWCLIGHSLWSIESIANIGSNRACGSPSGPQRQVRGPGSVVPRELYRNMEHLIFKGHD